MFSETKFVVVYFGCELRPNSKITSMKISIPTPLLILFLLGFCSCEFTSGEGPILQRELELAPFSGIELDGSFDVSIDQGATQSVLVVGHENIIDKLKLNVMDEVLYVSLEPGSYINYELEVKVVIPDLNSAVLLGSGDIRIGTFAGLDDVRFELDGSGDIVTNEESVIESTSSMEVALDGSGDIKLKVKAKKLSANSEGSGDMEFEGITESLIAELDGSGDIKAYDLEAFEADAILDGSGSIKLFVTKKLKASLDGSGDISYKGEPKVEATIDGAGTIEQK